MKKRFSTIMLYLSFLAFIALGFKLSMTATASESISASLGGEFYISIDPLVTRSFPSPTGNDTVPVQLTLVSSAYSGPSNITRMSKSTSSLIYFKVMRDSSDTSKITVTGTYVGSFDGRRYSTTIDYEYYLTVTSGKPFIGLTPSMTMSSYPPENSSDLELCIYPTYSSTATIKTLKSSNSSVATVENSKPSSFRDVKSADGVIYPCKIAPLSVTAKSAGTTTITVTMSNGLTAQASVTVDNIYPTNLSLSRTSMAVLCGKSADIRATVTPQGISQAVFWYVNGESKGKAPSFVISGDSPEIKKIEAKTLDANYSASCDVYFVKPESTPGCSVSASSESQLVMKPGEKTQLSATIPNYDGSLIWLSTSPDIASVDSNGIVTGLSSGDAYIYALKDINTYACNLVTVTNFHLPNPGEIHFVRDTDNNPNLNKPCCLSVGTSMDLYPLITYTSGSYMPLRSQFQWASSDPSAVSVNQDGIVTVLDAHADATITFTCNFNKDITDYVRIVGPWAAENITLMLRTKLEGRPSAKDVTNQKNIKRFRVIIFEPPFGRSTYYDYPIWSGDVTTDSAGIATCMLNFSEIYRWSDGYNVWIKGDNYLSIKINCSGRLRDGGIWDISADRVAKGGDANGDDCVSLNDFLLLRKSISTTSGDSEYLASADFNGDDCISLADFIILKKNFYTWGDKYVLPDGSTYGSSNTGTLNIYANDKANATSKFSQSNSTQQNTGCNLGFAGIGLFVLILPLIYRRRSKQ